MNRKLFPTSDVRKKIQVDEENYKCAKNQNIHDIKQSHNQILEIRNSKKYIKCCKPFNEIVSAVSFSMHMSTKHSFKAENQNIKYFSPVEDKSFDREIQILDSIAQMNKSISKDSKNKKDKTVNVQHTPMYSLHDKSLKPYNYNNISHLENCKLQENFDKNPSGLNHDLIIAELEKINHKDNSKLSNSKCDNITEETSFSKIREAMLIPEIFESELFSKFYKNSDMYIKNIENYDCKLKSNECNIFEIDEEFIRNPVIKKSQKLPIIYEGKDSIKNNLEKEKNSESIDLYKNEKRVGLEFIGDAHNLKLLNESTHINDKIVNSNLNHKSPLILSEDNEEKTYHYNSNVDIKPFNINEDSEEVNSTNDTKNDRENSMSPNTISKKKLYHQYQKILLENVKYVDELNKANRKQKRKYNTKNRKSNDKGVHFYNIELDNDMADANLYAIVQNDNLIDKTNEVNYYSPELLSYNDSYRCKYSNTNNSLNYYPSQGQNNTSNNTTSNNNLIYNNLNGNPDFRYMENQNFNPVFVNTINQGSSLSSFPQNSSFGVIPNAEYRLINANNFDNSRIEYEKQNLHQKSQLFNNNNNNTINTNFAENNDITGVFHVPLNQNINIQQNVTQNTPRSNIVGINNQVNLQKQSNNISNNVHPSTNGLMQNNMIYNNGQQNMNYMQSYVNPNIQYNIPIYNQSVITSHIPPFPVTDLQNKTIGNINRNMSQNNYNNITKNNQNIIINPTNQQFMIANNNQNANSNLKYNAKNFNGSNIYMAPSNNMNVNMEGYAILNPQMESRIINHMQHINQLNNQSNIQQQKVLTPNNNNKYAYNIIRDHVPNNITQKQCIVQQPTNIFQPKIIPVQNMTTINGNQQLINVNNPQNIQFMPNQPNQFNNQRISFNNNQIFQNESHFIGQLNMGQPQYIIIPDGRSNTKSVQNGRAFHYMSNNTNTKNLDPNVMLVQPAQNNK